jgi:hypothetical protein
MFADWPILVAVFAFCAFLYGSILAHKIGHALVSQAVGLHVGSFGMGLGRPVVNLRLGRQRLYLGLARPLMGVTFIGLKRLDQSPLSLAASIGGGAVANLILAVVLLGLWWLTPWASALWLAGACLNGFIALSSLLPMRVRVGKIPFRSDASLALNVLRAGALDSEPAAIFQQTRLLEPLWRSLGDRTTLTTYLIAAAQRWMAFDARERAHELLSQSESTQKDGHPLQHFLAAVGRADIEGAFGRWTEADSACAEAASQLESFRDPACELILACVKAKWQAARGDVTPAAESLHAWSAHPLVKSRPYWHIVLLATQVRIQCRQGDWAQVESTYTQYQSLRQRHASDFYDWHFSYALAQARSARGEDKIAADAFARAVQSFHKLYAGLGNPEDEACLLAAQSAFLSEAQAALRKIGRSKEAEEAIVFAPVTVREEEALKKQRRLLRIAGWLTLAHVGVFVLMVLLGFVVVSAKAAEPSQLRSDPLVLAIATCILTSTMSVFLGSVYGLIALVFFRRRLVKFSGIGGIALVLGPWVGVLCAWIEQTLFR